MLPSAYIHTILLYADLHLSATCDSDMCYGCGWQGGITDGFDRFSEPIEDIRITMEREANM